MRKLLDLEFVGGSALVRLGGDDTDATNKLTQARVAALTECVESLAASLSSRSQQLLGLVLAGNEHFFSAGADLEEIAALSGPKAYGFAAMGQRLMNAVAGFPAPTIAAVRGYCMGGGFDLALACGSRIAAPHAVFGHRGAALGLITGWGGTQRLPRIVGRSRALEMFIAAEKVNAHRAMQLGLVETVVNDPVAVALARLASDDVSALSGTVPPA
jgi:enoyl-CoA hydratase